MEQGRQSDARIMRTVDRAIDNLLAKQANEEGRAGVIYTFVWFTAKRMVQAFGLTQARATYAQIIDAIDDQIAQPITPASVLPPEEVDVLVETTDNGWRQAVVIKLSDSEFQWSGYKDGAAGDYFPSENVIRWVPLPKENGDVR